MKKYNIREILYLSVWPIGMLFLITFIMPLNKRVIPGMIFFLFFFSILQFRFRFNRNLWPLILMCGIYLLLILGLFQSEHMQAGKKELEFKASLIAFPLIACMLPLFSRTRIMTLLWLFTFGSLLFVFIAIGYGIYRTAQFNDLEYLGYGRLGIYFHPTYAATYQVFSLVFLLLRGQVGDYLFRNKIAHYIACAIMVIFVSMLASKAGILSAIGMIVFCGWVGWKIKKSWKEVLLIVVPLVSLSVVSALFIPKSSQRIESAFKSNAQDGVKAEAHSSGDLREVAWKASLQVIGDNPLGVGTGNTTPELVKHYEAMGENYAAKKNLNSHNQFLQITCELGWPGLILLVAALILMIRFSWKTMDWIFLGFVILCTFHFLFESFLEVQAGLVFFCLWSMVFLKREAKPEWER